MNDTQRQELAPSRRAAAQFHHRRLHAADAADGDGVQRDDDARAVRAGLLHCGPEQAMLLRTLVGSPAAALLDIGSFGLRVVAIAEAIPEDAELTCLGSTATTPASPRSSSRRNVNFMVGKAMDALKRFEEDRLFIALDRTSRCTASTTTRRCGCCARAAS